jgi:hypothetical protein
VSRHSPRCSGVGPFTLALPVLLVLHAAPAVVADTLTVTDCGDSVPGGGPGQLRYLMNNANAGDTIVVPACAIFLLGSGGDDANQNGDLDFTKNLIIQGAGQAATVFGLGDPNAERVLHVLPGVNVTLIDLSVRNAAYFFDGAGIYNSGQLTLARVTVSNNTANSSNGGGIYNDVPGVLVVVDSTVTGNYAAVGGGIYNKGSATVVLSSFSQNITGGGAGGIFNTGIFTLVDSTVSGNHGNYGFGGGISNSAQSGPGVLTIMGSTISANTVQLGGGGISNDGTLDVTNSTISGNSVPLTAGSTGGGIQGHSSGVGTPSVRLTRVTLTGNAATSGSALYYGGPTNGTFEGTIVTGGCIGGGANSSNGHNLDQGHICFVAGPTDLVDVADPKLGPLFDNGGPTLTHMPLAASPAVDAGGATCANPADQRGVTRPQGAGCDIGAVERDVIFQDGFEST